MAGYHAVYHRTMAASDQTTYWARSDDFKGYFHSQDGQDKMVVQLLKGKKNGFFVDLAANDALYLSNTRTLERDFGWKGLCIEGNTMLTTRLGQLRDCTIIEAAVAENVGTELTFRVGGAPGGSERGWGAGLTKFQGQKNGTGEEQNVDIKVYTNRLVDILDSFNAPAHMDYLSLDIEGAETEAMKTFPFERYKFDLMSCEAPDNVLRKQLFDNGYYYMCSPGAGYGEALFFHKTFHLAEEIHAVHRTAVGEPLGGYLAPKYVDTGGTSITCIDLYALGCTNISPPDPIPGCYINYILSITHICIRIGRYPHIKSLKGQTATALNPKDNTPTIRREEHVAGYHPVYRKRPTLPHQMAVRSLNSPKVRLQA